MNDKKFLCFCRTETVIFLLTLFFLFACTAGDSDDTGPVAVSFSVSTPSPYRIVSVNEGLDNNKLAYYYKATPLWTGSDFTSIQGKTQSFVKISYRSGMSLGLFTQGNWLFEVEARVIDANEPDETRWQLAFSGSVETYISQNSYLINVPVVQNAGAYGKVAITVTAPTAGDSDTISISYTGAQTGSVPVGNINISRSEGENRHTTFTVASTSFKAGTYTFFLTYNDGTNDVGGATVSLNVYPEMTANIFGTVESGLWQNESVTLTGLHPFGIQLSAAGNKIEIARNESLVYTCTKTQGSLDIETYEWYVNGVFQPGQTSSTFTWWLPTMLSTIVLYLALKKDALFVLNFIFIHEREKSINFL